MIRPNPIEVCLEALGTGLRHELHYHTLEHTLLVMRTVEVIAMAENVNQRDRMILQLGAAAHDCGFLLTTEEHEEAGCRWIEPLLSDLGYSERDIQIVKGMIMATRIPQSPKTHLEEILCDADLGYIGTDRYEEIAHRLFLEINALGKKLTKTEWLDIQIRFLERHSFFTEYARKTWNEPKARVLESLKADRAAH